jgi:hypothetical protein
MQKIPDFRSEVISTLPEKASPSNPRDQPQLIRSIIMRDIRICGAGLSESASAVAKYRWQKKF